VSNAAGGQAGSGPRQWGALVSQHVRQPPYDYRLRVTAAGRDLYEREWARYRTLHPDVEAPEPVAQP
jgi:hypothetical protein